MSSTQDAVSVLASDAFIASSFSLSTTADSSSDSPAHALQNKRLARVVRCFQAAFSLSNIDALRIAIAPGRVNLIGEHIDYEGYSVLPMAVAQSMAVAISSSSSPSATKAGITLRIANTDPAYATASISLASCDPTGDALFQLLAASLDASTAWARYVLCGYMAVIEWSPSLTRQSLALDLLVDGTIPPACGLSSSSAFVVASALALASFLCVGDLPKRTQLAEKCRYAEQYVGTAGGGMDQAVSCLATKNAALFVRFAPTLEVTSVAFPNEFQQDKVVLLVVNSGVQAHKAQDARTRFNKRVVECALATKLMGKRLGVLGWETMTTLRELQYALEEDRGRELTFQELLESVDVIRDNEAFTLEELQTELSPLVPLSSLFKDSRLEKAAQQILQTSSTFRLWQRARHVWSEADRVLGFRALLTGPERTDRLSVLGELMLASHASCRDDYECSCSELDLIVETAQRAGAYGARLTGAGWGGCAVVLVAASDVERLRRALKDRVFNGKAPVGAMFESSACDGAQLFQICD